MINKQVILFVLLVVSFIPSSEGQKRVVCYHGTWSVYRHSHGTFGVEDIDPRLCTHLIYSFFGISASEGKIRILDPYLDLEENYGRGNIRKFNDLKKINPNLKTLAAIGGWNEGSKPFSMVANDPILRRNFAVDAREFALRHNFDGIDLDWEYPGRLGGDPSKDRDAFTLLLREMKEELSKHGLLLTAAVAAAEMAAAISYDIPEVVKYLDFLNVMAYDFHGAWDPVIGFNAPFLAGPADTTDIQKQLNVKASISYWLANGAPSDKIVLGIPFYGRSFQLQSREQHEPGDTHYGPGIGGPYTGESGNYGFNEICEFIRPSPMYTRVWSTDQAVPYYHSHNQWIGYDDLESIQFKVDFINENQLGGAMIWSIETDDFLNFCQLGHFPLLRRINRILGNEIEEINTTTTEDTTTTITPTTIATETPVPPTTDRDCLQDGYFRDPNDCAEYFICFYGHKYEFRCPHTLLFDTRLNYCNWSYLVDC